MADGDLVAWQKALDSIMILNAEKIIPGHGPFSTNKDPEDMKSYIVAFDKKARELAAVSSQADYIAAEF